MAALSAVALARPADLKMAETTLAGNTPAATAAGPVPAEPAPAPPPEPTPTPTPVPGPVAGLGPAPAPVGPADSAGEDGEWFNSLVARAFTWLCRTFVDGALNPLLALRHRHGVIHSAAGADATALAGVATLPATSP